jgi:hypothetical protein
MRLSLLQVPPAGYRTVRATTARRKTVDLLPIPSGPVCTLLKWVCYVAFTASTERAGFAAELGRGI